MRDVIQECLQIRRAYDSFSPGPTERSHLIGWGHNGSTGETPVGPHRQDSCATDSFFLLVSISVHSRLKCFLLLGEKLRDRLLVSESFIDPQITNGHARAGFSGLFGSRPSSVSLAVAVICAGLSDLESSSPSM